MLFPLLNNLLKTKEDKSVDFNHIRLSINSDFYFHAKNDKKLEPFLTELIQNNCTCYFGDETH